MFFSGMKNKSLDFSQFIISASCASFVVIPGLQGLQRMEYMRFPDVENTKSNVKYIKYMEIEILTNTNLRCQ